MPSASFATVRTAPRAAKRGGGASGENRTLNIAASWHTEHALISIGKCGKSTTRVCEVQFSFDNNCASSLYGTRSGDTRQQSVNGTQELVGFRGRAGQEIGNLDAVYRNRQRPPFTLTRQISGNQIATAIDVLLATLELRLNNIGPREGNSWHVERGSWLRLAGDRTDFDVPEFTMRRDNWRRRYFYYVSDINARSAAVEFERARQTFLLEILFEDGGREMKGKCRWKRANGSYFACPGPNEGDGDAPDVHWSFPSIDVTLEPQVVQRPNGRNGVGLRAINARVRGDFGMNGLCGPPPNQCHTILNGWKGALVTSLEASLIQAINA